MFFRKYFIFIFLFLLLLAIVYSLSATSSFAATDQERIAELQKQILQLEEEAEKYRDGIADQQAQAKTLQGQISNLKNQISQLEVQISLTGKKIDKTGIQIGDLETNIGTTQQKINEQKNTIADLLLYINRRDDENIVDIFVKNDNLSDFLRQDQYARSVNNSLLDLVDDLKNEKTILENNKTDLEGKKEDLEQLKSQQTVQRQSLGSVKVSKDTLLKQTKGQEAAYQKLLKETEAKKALFFSELRELETQVIQGGLYIVHVTASALPKKGTKLFEWPEISRRVTQGYGCTTYARCNRSGGAYGGAPHNGVDMAAGFGSAIKSIADGTIIANGRNDGWGNWVAIQHPGVYNLVSVYAHMSSLSFLRVGTQVKVGDVIGYEGSTGNSTGSHLHLSIYKDFFTYVNSKKNSQLYFNYFEGTINPLDYL